MTLTIYSCDYDMEDIHGKGLSNCIFLDPSNESEKDNGKGPFKKLQDVLNYCNLNDIHLDSISYMYRENNEQFFVKCPLA